MNIPTPIRSLAVTSALLAVIGAGFGSYYGLSIAQESCVGKPLGTKDCPTAEQIVRKIGSGTYKDTNFLCGNGSIDPGEECDLGAYNGLGTCTKQCLQLFCGDGMLSIYLGEECEPDVSEALYALDGAGNLIVERTFVQLTCGNVCAAPRCGNGVCVGGCKREFKGSCTALPQSSSSSSASTSEIPLLQGSGTVDIVTPVEPPPASVTSFSVPVSEGILVAQAGTGTDTFGLSSSASPSQLCGNATVDAGEDCDDGNKNNGDDCPNDCGYAICGDGLKEGRETCDDGNLIQNDGCTTACRRPECGNGIRESEEECDDGNKIDDDGCTNFCIVPICGNETTEGAEECDDGNKLNADACRNNCRFPACGDGIRDSMEECDDGNTEDTDYCTSACKAAFCGDSIVQTGEQCDDGNISDADDCLSGCKLPVCGNGVLEGREQCDDGNLENTDECTRDCRLPVCGNGRVEGAEQCDDDNQDDTDSCTNLCTRPLCGNAIVEGTEQCDAGEANSNATPDACRENCLVFRCGDGVKDTVEECDGGDRCTPECIKIPLITWNRDTVVLTALGSLAGVTMLGGLITFLRRR